MTGGWGWTRGTDGSEESYSPGSGARRSTCIDSVRGTGDRSSDSGSGAPDPVPTPGPVTGVPSPRTVSGGVGSGFNSPGNTCNASFGWSCSTEGHLFGTPDSSSRDPRSTQTSTGDYPRDTSSPGLAGTSCRSGTVPTYPDSISRDGTDPGGPFGGVSTGV